MLFVRALLLVFFRKIFVQLLRATAYLHANNVVRFFPAVDKEDRNRERAIEKRKKREKRNREDRERERKR